ncbi:MAG: T9SS type A sorting domain-containing protein, partial [Bacteroidia bacterium]
EEKIDFTVDGNIIYTYNPENKNADTWPFDADQYMLINTAIIGGIPSGFTESPFVIDYVRIYSDTQPNATEEINPINFELYPNPSTNSINLSYSTSSNNYTYKIIDQVGRVLIENQTNKNQLNIDISDLHKGIYQLVIMDNNGTLSKSFIKQE